MKKPQNCHQDWSKMTPTEGGRICGSCEKLIVDFRKKSWQEIETQQSEHNNSLCGVYSEKQLNHWGREVPKTNFCSKNLLYASMILSMNAAVSDLQGKTNFPFPESEIIQIDQETKQTKNQSPDSDDLISISGKITDKESGEPLIGVTVLLKDTQTGTCTRVDGTFKIKDYNKNNSKTITLVISYTGYETQEMILSDNQINQRNLSLGIVAMSAGVEVISFYVTTKQTPWQKFKSRIRRLFRKK